jgi:hypothetical protein
VLVCTVIRFVSISVKFGICTVVGHLLKLIYEQVSQVRILAFNKCPIKTHDHANAQKN